MKRASSEDKTDVALWKQAFRPLFLAGAIFSASAVIIWVLQLYALVDFLPQNNALLWHMHEMLFGFVGAIVVGFLLTAVQNWTGLRTLNGRVLQVLVSLWLVARIGMALGSPAFVYPVMVLNVGFYSLAAFLIGRLLIKVKNKRNYFFIPALIMLGVMSGLAQYGAAAGNLFITLTSIYGAILLISQIIMIIGGRVIPMFTASGTQTQRRSPTPRLDTSIYLVSWLSIPLVLFSMHDVLFREFAGLTLLLAATANTVRSVNWYRHEIWTTPLVWSLHAGYAFIAIGQGLLGLHFSGFGIALSAGVHALAAGAMGTMILAMISRVSLGHTGRIISANLPTTASLVLVVVAGLLRVLVALFPVALGSHALLLVATLWALAYFIFVVNYWKILTAPGVGN